MQLPLPLPELQLALAASAPPLPRRVFCNRSLRLDQIDWVGFDMDYTLAIYRQEEMDRLSIEATARKLVERGYPREILAMPYRTDFPIRGLLIDKKLGNILKMDRYQYAKKAFHGMRELTRDERRDLYHTKRLRPGTSRYHWVDTLYALSEVSVYAAVIDELERDGVSVDFDQLFTDVRACIDVAHQDGSILDVVMSDLPRFVLRDRLLGQTLHKLRSAGKKLFLLTNSRAAYTDRMMAYLLGDGLAEYPSWKNYFDVIVTASKKPRFFAEQAPFEEVLDDGTTRPATQFERGRVYQGGNISDFERLAGSGGDRVLYVGDHIYGDVLRAKKESSWRTAMIIQEMDDELRANAERELDIARLDQLEDLRDELYQELRDRQRLLKEIQRVVEQHVDAGRDVPTEVDTARLTHKRAVDRIRIRLRAIDVEFDETERHLERACHPFWGSLFKCGPEVSSFGDQVERFACLYTSRATNFLAYSPMHYFRSPRDRMPHEL